MRPDRFSLAKAWIHEERSTPEEAKATWDAMDQEFNENRKIFLASAESDAVKDITLDMTPEQAQASALSNFRKLFSMAKGGVAGMLGE